MINFLIDLIFSFFNLVINVICPTIYYLLKSSYLIQILLKFEFETQIFVKSTFDFFVIFIIFFKNFILDLFFSFFFLECHLEELSDKNEKNNNYLLEQSATQNNETVENKEKKIDQIDKNKQNPNTETGKSVEQFVNEYYFGFLLELFKSSQIVPDSSKPGIKNSLIKFFKTFSVLDINFLEYGTIARNHLKSNSIEPFDTTQCVELMGTFQVLQEQFPQHTYGNLSDQFVHCLTLGMMEKKYIYFEKDDGSLEAFCKTSYPYYERLKQLLDYHKVFTGEIPDLLMAAGSHAPKDILASDYYILAQIRLATMVIDGVLLHYDEFFPSHFTIHPNMKKLLLQDNFYYRQFLNYYNSVFFIPLKQEENSLMNNPYARHLVRLYRLYYAYNKRVENIPLSNDLNVDINNLVNEKYREFILDYLDPVPDPFAYIDQLKIRKLMEANHRGLIKDIDLYNKQAAERRASQPYPLTYEEYKRTAPIPRPRPLPSLPPKSTRPLDPSYRGDPRGQRGQRGQQGQGQQRRGYHTCVRSYEYDIVQALEVEEYKWKKYCLKYYYFLEKLSMRSLKFLRYFFREKYLRERYINQCAKFPHQFYYSKEDLFKLNLLARSVRKTYHSSSINSELEKFKIQYLPAFIWNNKKLGDLVIPWIIKYNERIGGNTKTEKRLSFFLYAAKYFKNSHKVNESLDEKYKISKERTFLSAYNYSKRRKYIDNLKGTILYGFISKFTNWDKLFRKRKKKKKEEVESSMSELTMLDLREPKKRKKNIILKDQVSRFWKELMSDFMSQNEENENQQEGKNKTNDSK
jgi:hypothetical protein